MEFNMLRFNRKNTITSVCTRYETFTVDKNSKHKRRVKIPLTLVIFLTAGMLTLQPYLWGGFSIFKPLPDSKETILSLLKSRDAAIKAVLKVNKGSYSEVQREKLIVLINDIMDFSAMSQTALGEYWEELDEEQKNVFVSDFSKLVKSSSVKKLDIFQAVIDYKQVTMNGEKARVFTRATYDRTRTNVDYELHRKNGRWLVTDFSIDDVSTAVSYQKSFQRIMRKHGFSGLMERLQKKLADESG